MLKYNWEAIVELKKRFLKIPPLGGDRSESWYENLLLPGIEVHYFYKVSLSDLIDHQEAKR